MQNAKRKMQNDCVAFGDYFKHFPKENTTTVNCPLSTVHCPYSGGRFWRWGHRSLPRSGDTTPGAAAPAGLWATREGGSEPGGLWDG